MFTTDALVNAKGEMNSVNTYGPYDKLEANIWAWIVKTVKGNYNR